MEKSNNQRVSCRRHRCLSIRSFKSNVLIALPSSSFFLVSVSALRTHTNGKIKSKMKQHGAHLNKSIKHSRASIGKWTRNWRWTKPHHWRSHLIVRRHHEFISTANDDISAIILKAKECSRRAPMNWRQNLRWQINDKSLPAMIYSLRFLHSPFHFFLFIFAFVSIDRRQCVEDVRWSRKNNKKKWKKKKEPINMTM